MFSHKDGSTAPKSTSPEPEFLDRQTEIYCPRCEQPLSVAMIDEVKVVACASCSGVLMQCQEFATLVRSQRASFIGLDSTPQPMDQRQIEQRCGCPACYQPMETHPYMGPGNVVIDSCAACELIWLDGAELGKIVRAPGTR